MARLTHPNVVTIHDIGDEDGQPYIVAEYMGGGDVAGLLREADDHRLPIDRAITIADAVAQALAHAHAQRVIHRDVKPGNIWLAADGSARLGDFGLALAIDQTRMTTEGTMLGTVAYMPPEQATGGVVDPRSDLYALGCVLYEMVTGRPPFPGDDVLTVISQHLNTAPVAPTWDREDCPAGLDALILALLEKDAAKRPASAADVRTALATANDATPTSTPATDRPATTPGPVYRRTFVGRERELGQLKAVWCLKTPSRGLPGIRVMEATKDRSAPESHGSRRTMGMPGSIRRLVPQRLVGSRGVVVHDVFLQDVPEVALAQHEHVVETLAPEGADDALRDGVRLGGPHRGQHRRDPVVFQNLITLHPRSTHGVSRRESAGLPGAALHPGAPAPADRMAAGRQETGGDACRCSRRRTRGAPAGDAAPSVQRDGPGSPFGLCQ